METDYNFEQLFKECHKQLFITAFNYLHNEELAKKSVQQTALLAFENYNNLRDKQNFKTWITRILLNTIHKHYQKHKNVAKLNVEMSEYSNIDENSPSYEIKDTMMLANAMDSLNETEKRILILKFISGYTVPEISEILRLPQRSINSKISKIIDKLKVITKDDKLLEKLAHISELSYNSLSIPVSDYILGKTINIKQKSKLYFRVRFLLFTFIILIAVLYIGFSLNTYYRMKLMNEQGKGQINVYNVVESKKGTKIKLEKVYSDGFNSYVKIKASGFENIPDVDSDAGIANKLKQVYLTDNAGNKWEWRHRDKTISSGGTGTAIYAHFDVSGLFQNKALLYFDGAPADGAKIEIKVVLNNGQIIKFSDLTIHVTKNVIRDVSDLNLTIDLPYAQGKIQKITYAKTKSEFVVDWTVDDKLYMKYDCDYYKTHMAFLDNGKKEFEWHEFTPFQRAEGKILTNNSLIFGTIKPDQTLTIKLYNQDKSDGNMFVKGDFDKVMCVIPPME